MTALIGHDAQVAAFRRGLDSGRLHHAWLISGPEGVGKGLFARSAAQRILAQGEGRTSALPGFEVDPETPTAWMLRSRSHPDYRLLRREVWDGKAPNDYIVPENERSGSEPLARGIRIKQIRMLAPVLTVRPTLSDRRVIVIDSADELELPAANALLKMLEEPPIGTIFLLVSHSPQRLLPTIRSRCRQVRLATLDDDAMASALRAALPDADEAEIAALARVGEGAPGRALAFRGLDVGGLDEAMRRLAAGGDSTGRERAALAGALALKAAQPRYEAFLARAPSFLAAAARERKGAALGEALRLWERATELAGGAKGLSLDPQSVVFELAGLIAALAPRERVTAGH